MQVFVITVDAQHDVSLVVQFARRTGALAYKAERSTNIKSIQGSLCNSVKYYGGWTQ